MTNDEWLKDKCNRYRTQNPKCSLTCCMRRGGWNLGDLADYSKATCHAHEVLMELESLRNTVETQGAAMNALVAALKDAEAQHDRELALVRGEKLT